MTRQELNNLIQRARQVVRTPWEHNNVPVPGMMPLNQVRPMLKEMLAALQELEVPEARAGQMSLLEKTTR